MFMKLLSIVVVTAVSTSAVLADESPINKVLFDRDGEGFIPPAKNKALQALLAAKPQLTFLEACGVGDAKEIARQLAHDPHLATTWNDFGWSALHLAAFSGSPEAVKLLLDQGAPIDVRARTRFKNTPLQVSLLDGQLATAKILLERGADPLVRQAKGFAPIHEAALAGRRDIVALLLEHGAELDARANDGRTAVTEARRGKHDELAAFLIAKGARDVAITADLGAAPKD